MQENGQTPIWSGYHLDLRVANELQLTIKGERLIRDEINFAEYLALQEATPHDQHFLPMALFVKNTIKQSPHCTHYIHTSTNQQQPQYDILPFNPLATHKTLPLTTPRPHTRALAPISNDAAHSFHGLYRKCSPFSLAHILSTDYIVSAHPSH